MSTGNHNIVHDIYSPVTLRELDAISLMDRTDTKYLMSAHHLPAVLQKLAGNYRVLEISGERVFRYSTTYYDTSDFFFFNQHVTGKLNRNKVRYRVYENTGTAFLEVKRRTNKNRTIKWRIARENLPMKSFDKESADFLGSFVPLNPDLLKPALTNRFNRITLADNNMSERITIDYNLGFGINGSPVHELPYIAIIEIKQSGKNNSIAHSVLRSMGVRPNGFSKYCIGASLIYDLKKANILKEKHLLINKLKKEYYESNVG